jgi:hypothetical protein
MLPEDNPFANDDLGAGSYPFGTADQVVCCRCGGSVPREEASFKVKSGPSWGSFLWKVLFWGPIGALLFGPLFEDDKQERGYYCPLCLHWFRREERRKKILTVVFIVVIVALTMIIALQLVN